MSYYGYQYKQQCFIPGGLKTPAPACPQQCHGPGLVPCGSCSPCAPAGAKVCPGRRSQSPRCAGPCRPGCLETRVVEGHHHSSSSSSSCSSSRCLEPCPAPFPQPLAQGRGLGVLRCPQVCAPAVPVCQEGSGPYSYQWSNSYQYNCGQ